MRFDRQFWLTLALAVALNVTTVQATTIRAVSLDQMAVSARLVFEGKVIDRQVLTDPATGRLFTRVTFSVLDVIKGDDPGAQLTLDFLGGHQRDQGLEYKVAEMVYPESGESGIYFVEDPGQRLVNPLYGWTQGHFVSFKGADGIERIRAASGQPVTGLDFSAEAAKGKFSHDLAEGVITRQLGQAQPAISVEAFKQGLREYLETRP